MDELIANEMEPSEPKESFKSKTLEELHNLLNEAVANEDYEKAAKFVMKFQNENNNYNSPLLYEKNIFVNCHYFNHILLTNISPRHR